MRESAMWRGAVGALVVAATVAQPARAVDVGVTAKKLIVIDKLISAGKAKTVFVSKDPAAGKGPGIDPNGIGVIFDFFYAGEGGPAAGQFVLAPGETDGTDGWVVNKDTVAKYVNKSAPEGATGAKVGVIKPAKLLKLIGKNLGDDPMDVIGAGAPVGDVCAVCAVTNDGQTIRHCAVFAGVDANFKVVGGGTGRKLVAKNGMPDVGCAVCSAGAPSTTTSSTSTSSSSTTTTSLPLTCGDGVVDPGETCDDGNTSDNDACPSDCNVESCTAGATQVSGILSFQSPGVPIAGLNILLDYPEGLVDYAGAQPLVSGLLPPQDFGHALFVVRAAATGLDPTGILRTIYNRCDGAAVPTNGDFGCEVQLAVDAATNPVEGVTCTLALE